MFQGYREWERGYRRQWCIERQVEDDPEHIEDRSNADWCYGSITDGDFVVDGTTYELEGRVPLRGRAQRPSSTSISTEEVDLSALAGREFLINGVTFAVTTGAVPTAHGATASSGAPQWTASMGWTVGSTIWVGLKAHLGTRLRKDRLDREQEPHLLRLEDAALRVNERNALALNLRARFVTLTGPAS